MSDKNDQTEVVINALVKLLESRLGHSFTPYKGCIGFRESKENLRDAINELIEDKIKEHVFNFHTVPQWDDGSDDF